MAYVADLSIWDSFPSRESILHSNEHESNELTSPSDLSPFDHTPGKFALAPVHNPALFASRLFGCGGSLPSPFSLHMNPPGAAAAAAAANGSSRALAPKKGTTTLGFVYKGGIIIAVDSRASMGCVISSQTVCKVLEISDVILGTMAGGAADCSYWERHLSKLCHLFELRNQEKIPVAAASNLLANIFYSWRGYGLCCGTMIAGWNANKEEPELYFVNDEATRLKGRLFSCGSGSTFAYGVLDNTYKWDMTDEEAIELGRRAIYHATHRDGGSGGVCRVYRCIRGGWERVVAADDVSELHYKYAAERGSDGSVL